MKKFIMISKNQLKILDSIKIYLEDKDKELLDDYITFHNILMAMYARHLFRRDANWHKINISYNVNYKYIRENETNYKFTDLEKKLKFPNRQEHSRTVETYNAVQARKNKYLNIHLLF